MSPTEHQDDSGRDDEVLAGEYVLGALSREERRAVEVRIASEPLFAARVHRWESDLSTLNAAYEEVRPPDVVLARVEERLFPVTATMASRATEGLWNSLLFWRGLAAALLLAVAGLAIAISGIGRPAPSEAPLVAQLATKNSPISLVALYDARTGKLKLTPVAATRQASEPKSLELWMIKGKEPPVSLGLVPQNGRGEIIVPQDMRNAVESGTVLAISLEPRGGSPTGQPTGPVLAAGPARPL